MEHNKAVDSLIVGGGLVGISLACGLVRQGRSVAVVDGDDRDYRASRGNFGLVWVQGKGAGYAPYANWSLLGGETYPEFVDVLEDETGINVQFSQPGGLDFCLDENEWNEREHSMQAVSAHTEGRFGFEMMDYHAVKSLIPEIGPEVLGASFSRHDGHLNPLYLLRALHQWFANMGGCYLPGQRVRSIVATPSGGFSVHTDKGSHSCGQVVLCARLGNGELTPSLGMEIPLHPVRGQLLITQRVPPFLRYPSIQVRQTGEGTLQIGDTLEFVDYDDGVTLDAMQSLAKRAVKLFPHLSSVPLVRAWGALRVMTDDGMPVYQQSQTFPGAYAVSCHSGVSLAALHVGAVANWICEDTPHPLIKAFDISRSA